MKNIRLICCCVFAMRMNVAAQQYLNLGFERLSVEGIHRPWGWSVSALAPESTIILDTASRFSGKYSLHFALAGKATSAGESSIRYWLQPYELKNKQVKIAGWIKKQGFSGTVSIAVESYRGEGIRTDSVYKIIPGPDSGDSWKSFGIALRISGEVHSVYLTLAVTGAGNVWFDNLSLFAGKKKMSSLTVAPDISETAIKELRKNVSAFKTTAGSKAGQSQPFTDLLDFKRIAGDARILALGECTHGTGDFFTMKHRLLECAVKEMGFRIFALEANQLNVELINHYVQTGDGNLVKLMAASLFAVWNTQEVFDMIEWVRWYNSNNPHDKVLFQGYDMQDPSRPIDSLVDFIRRHSPGLHQEVSNLLRDYRMAWKKQDYPVADDSTRRIWKNNADTVFAWVIREKSKWLQQADADDDRVAVEWAVQNARVVRQAAHLAWAHSIAYRDSCMADNIGWILDQHPAAKMVLWAHDTHICFDAAVFPALNYNEGITMGTFLHNRYGHDYRAFGFSTYQGTYTSTVSYTDFRRVTNNLYPSPPGSLDEALHRIAKHDKTPCLIADLRPFRHLPFTHWLQQNRPVRFITYATSDYGYEQYVSLPSQFDAIIFIDQTKGSKKIEH